MIIVTGGAGFIGSAFIHGLNQSGKKDILVVDILGSDNKWLNLRKLQFQEILSPEALEDWLATHHKKVTLLVHLGACSSTTETDVDFLLRNNVNYSKLMWNLCTRWKIPLIYASSAATYGMGESGFSDDETTIGSLLPINPYGWSKQLFDVWVKDQRDQPPYWFGLKYFNVFGPNEYHKEHMRSLVAKAVPAIQKTKKLSLFKSYREGIAHGDQRRDFIYIKDIVDVMLHMIEHLHQLTSGIYNLGTGEARSFHDLALAIFKAMALSPNIEWIEMPENMKNQYQYFTEADVRKMRQGLQYTQSFRTLEESVSDYVCHYLLSQDPYL